MTCTNHRTDIVIYKGKKALCKFTSSNNLFASRLMFCCNEYHIDWIFSVLINVKQAKWSIDLLVLVGVDIKVDDYVAHLNKYSTSTFRFWLQMRTNNWYSILMIWLLNNKFHCSIYTIAKNDWKNSMNLKEVGW